jgi:hypothetical protein
VWINPPAKLSTIQYITSQPVHTPALMRRDSGAPEPHASDHARTTPPSASGSSQANCAAARGRNRRSGPVGESSVITGGRTSVVGGAVWPEAAGEEIAGLPAGADIATKRAAPLCTNASSSMELCLVLPA